MVFVHSWSLGRMEAFCGILKREGFGNKRNLRCFEGKLSTDEVLIEDETASCASIYASYLFLFFVEMVLSPLKIQTTHQETGEAQFSFSLQPTGFLHPGVSSP